MNSAIALESVQYREKTNTGLLVRSLPCQTEMGRKLKDLRLNVMLGKQGKGDTVTRQDIWSTALQVDFLYRLRRRHSQVSLRSVGSDPRGRATAQLPSRHEYHFEVMNTCVRLGGSSAEAQCVSARPSSPQWVDSRDRERQIRLFDVRFCHDAQSRLPLFKFTIASLEFNSPRSDAPRILHQFTHILYHS
ncbi:hypothetical protein PM082_023340 [Marasmius tenuissimus]|nr:hypothetical protein PM082_023340 [Marasmius tenuissimus]